MDTSFPGALLSLFAFVFFTFLFSVNGIAQPDHIWSRSYGGSQPDRLLDMAFDPAGNVYVTGYVQGLVVLNDDGDTLSQGAVGNHDIILHKYSPQGELLWSRAWAASGSDEGRALSIDSEGNLYLTGIFEGVMNFGSYEEPIILETEGWGSDAFLMKINQEGTVQWARGLGGEFASTGNGVAVADDGHVVVCGRFLDSLKVSPPLPGFEPQAGSDGNRIFMIKFSDEGDFMWLHRLGGAAGMAPKSFKATPDGGFVMAGDFIGTLLLSNPGHPSGSFASFTSLTSDLYLAKYDAGGYFEWGRSIGNEGWEFMQDIAVFPNGDIAATGSFTNLIQFGEEEGEHVLNSVNNSDIFIARLSAEGNTLWAHSAGSPGSDEGLCVTVDNSLNVHIGGVFRQVMGFSNGDDFTVEAAGAVQLDAFLASYSPEGDFIWATAFDCPNSTEARTLAAGDNAIAVGGRFSGSLKTDFEESEPTLFSLFNESSMDAFVAYYEISDAGTEPCSAQGGTLEAPGNRSFCVGTGSPQSIEVNAVDAAGSFQRWALINSAGDIVATRTHNSLFNLDAFPQGNYRIRHMRYEGNVNNLGDVTHVSQVGMLTGCYSVSANAVKVFLRNEPEGGLLSLNGPAEICADDGPASVISLEVVGHSGAFSLYGIVSTPEPEVVAVNTDGIFDLNGLPSGSYLGAHLSYEQGVQLEGVSLASQLQGCYALSNSVPITLADCPGFQLWADPNPTEAMSRVSFGSGDNRYAALDVYDMSGRLVSSLWQGELQGGELYTRHFNAADLPAGIYLLRLSNAEEIKVLKVLLSK